MGRIGATAAVAALVLAAAQPSPDLVTIKTRLLQQWIDVIATNVTGADSDMDMWLPLITPQGTFADINYTAGLPTGWGGYNHCLRMAEMGSTYWTNTSKYYQSQTLLKGVSAVFASFWLVERPQDAANWWYQSIGCARPVGQLSLQFEDTLSAAQKTNATAVMELSQWESFSSTGTNAIDIGVVKVCEGLLDYQNATLVQVAFAKIYSTFSYAASQPPTSPEGPKTDGSYMQHGAQLYVGNYGASWIRSALLLIGATANTSYAATGDGYDVVTHVLLDGAQNMIAWPAAMWDIAVIGRQVTNPGGQVVLGPTTEANSDAGLLDPAIISSAGGNRSAELLALAARLRDPASAPPLPPSFTMYYATDYAVLRRPTWFASLRMISQRTAGGECINGQGLQSLHAADGATYLYQSGMEYHAIAATWDWQKLPGTTVQVGRTQLNCSTANGMGANDMVGGITDGVVGDGGLLTAPLTGFAFMDFAAVRYGQHLTAKKAYAFLDAAILMFANGITSVPGFAVTSTVESCLLNGAVTVSTDAGAHWAAVPSGNDTTFPLPSSAATTVLVHHNNVGYIFLLSATYAATAKLHLLNAPVTGNWSSVGTWPGPPATNPMFTLWLDHGDAPVTGQGYAYYVVPAVTLTAFQAVWNANFSSRYVIAANDLALQAVWDPVEEVFTAAVYDNTTAVKLPPQLPGTFLQLPFSMAVRVSTYVNATSGNHTWRMQYTQPPALLTDSSRRLGHTYNYWIYTNASFVPCSWPSCPGQWDVPKFAPTRPQLKYDCFSNGTIHFTNPPSQADEPDGVNPPFACALA